MMANFIFKTQRAKSCNTAKIPSLKNSYNPYGDSIENFYLKNATVVKKKMVYEN